MTFKKISVLVPTRQRIAQLRTMVESFAANTVGASAELVFRIDADDAASAAYLRELPWTVIIGPRLKGYASLPVFFEEMRAKATGDLFLTGNDDMVFRTPDWASKVLEVANQYPDGVFNLGVRTHNEGHYPFSIVSRKAVETMGTIHHPDIFWGDVYLRDVFDTYGRAILLPNVHIDHQWMGNAPDQVFREAQQRDAKHNNDAYWAKHRHLVQASADRLKEIVA